jgi:hypothetical protein
LAWWHFQPQALWPAGVLTRDAELRSIWQAAADNGAAPRVIVASLQKALSE